MGYIGGMGYVGLELLWRGWSHGSMFLVGGLCFLLIGAAARFLAGTPLVMRAAAGAGLVTAVELLAGVVLNLWLGMAVWDYSSQPLNLLGQVCVGYFFLWVVVSAGAGYLYTWLNARLTTARG